MTIHGIVIFLALSLPSLASAQTVAKVQVVGTVSAVNAPANQLSLKADNGDAVTVDTTTNTVILHVAPGVTDPAKAPKMALSEIAQGDRVVAYYRGAPGQKTVQATSLVVRTKADLADAARKDLDDWRKRGTVGSVSSVDLATKTIMLTVGPRTLAVTASDHTQYRRYSPDSAKPADAKPSSLAEINPGDQVHVLGDKNEAATSTTAEIIYAGTFRQLAATVVSIHPDTGEVQIKDLAAKKQITLRISPDSIMKRLDPPMAATLAKKFAPGRSPDIGQMLDRLPAMPLSELKSGDAIMVSTTMGSDPTRVTLITLLAGVEPLLTASPTAARDIMSGWTLSTGSDGN